MNPNRNVRFHTYSTQQANLPPPPAPQEMLVVNHPPSLRNRTSRELEAAEALLMLRYQFEPEYQEPCKSVTVLARAPSPSPPPPISAQCQPIATGSDKRTPKEQVRNPGHAAPRAPPPPLKKRIVPGLEDHRSETPAKTRVNSNITKSKTKLAANNPTPQAQRTCTKALLKSCRNMIREFLDNQELV